MMMMIQMILKLPILTASILEDHCEDIVDFNTSNINKYPKLSCNSCKETDIMIHNESDLLGKSSIKTTVLSCILKLIL